jgi:hypothetical protein
MANLTTPPSRVPIGYVLAGGQKLDVFLSPEWARYFQSLNTQVVVTGNAVGLPGAPGTTGAAGIGVALSDGDGEGAQFIPMPGPAGDAGAPGAALFLLQDDAPGEQPMGQPTQTTEAFIAPTLLNGWVNFGAPFNPAGYFKDAFGVVHLRGIVKSGTVNTAVFTLPAGYRPANTEQYAIYTGSTVGVVEILATGDVIAQVGNNTDFRFDGITFRAA